MPKRGHARTFSGELLRAVEKLRDEAMRNGNANWDAGFVDPLSYIENHFAGRKFEIHFPPSEPKLFAWRDTRFYLTA